MSALDRLKDRAGPVSNEKVVELPLSKIRFDPTQPRKAFHHIDGRVAPKDEEYIAELAKAIEFEGLIHPITVHENSDGTYLVVVGECRTRAHLKLERPTIRAVIRNDLTDPSRRLLFQLSENVNRKDLTDYELALSIKELMTGRDGVPPMKQVQIAQSMGKSEGWVSRFVKFGDEELQRTWWQSGIADTVEKLYRLATLATPLQLEIQRRVNLPEGDRERLEKPLNREVIDQITRSYKGKEKTQTDPVSYSAPPSEAAKSASASSGPKSAPNSSSDGIDSNDVIGKALSEAAAEGRAAKAPAAAPSVNPAPTGYTLSEEARAQILGSVPPPQGSAGAGEREAVRPPINCRISLEALLAFAKAVEADKEVSTSVRALWCDLTIPGGLAQLIANELTGMVVSEREVPAVVQKELAKLR